MMMHAQQFFNLTAQEVKVDSVLPVFNYAHELGYHYADSIYSVTIDYPEFINMSDDDVLRYQQLMGDRKPGAMPEVTKHISVSRKQGRLHVSFVPIVLREGRWQKLVSFQLKVKAHPQPLPGGKGAQSASIDRRATAESGRYAAKSVLASGTWVNEI